MNPLVSFGVEQHREAFEPPVGNKFVWEDSQFTVMVVRGPNARRDFHIDPSDEIFYMLKDDMTLELMPHVRPRPAGSGPRPDGARRLVGDDDGGSTTLTPTGDTAATTRRRR